MSRSWRAVTPELVRSIARSPLVADDATGYRYSVLTTADRILQAETHVTDAAHRLSRSADYLVGSGNHAIAFVNADHGYLTELPVGWFSAKDEWKLNPGYELKNHRFSRPITRGCVACHATDPGQDSPAANHYSPLADGIDCSRCHGDSDEHIAFWTESSGGEPPADARFVHPARLSPALANDVCFQCHLQGDVTLQGSVYQPVSFQAGQRLLDYRHDFLIAGQTEMLGVASHGARMLQSRCYTASDGQLTCIACHDAHQPAAAIRRESYDAACAKCHKASACGRPDGSLAGDGSTSCIACHMPQRATREGIHLVFTDHAIPRQPVSAVTSQPPLLKPDSDVQLVSAWLGETPDDATLGAAYVLLHETMGPQRLSLEIACRLLEKAVAANPADPETRYWLGSARLARGQPAQALLQFGELLKQQPEHHQARFRLALAHEAAGDAPSAIAEYERLLTATPGWLEPYPRLAQLHISRQMADESVRVLRAQIHQLPSAAAFATLALAERLAGRSHQQALATVDQAIALDSRLPEAYITRGTLWLLVGDHLRARDDFARTLAIDPSNAAAKRAIQTLRPPSQ